MQFLFVLFAILSLVTFAASVWMAVLGFRRHVAWGLGILFLGPFVAIPFAIRYWDEAKRPFLISMGSFAASMVLMVLGFGALGGFAMMSAGQQIASGEMTEGDMHEFMEGQMDRMENSGMLDAAEQQDLQKIRGVYEEMKTEAGPGTAGPVPTVAVVDDDPGLGSSVEAILAGVDYADPALRNADPGILPGDRVALNKAGGLVGALLRAETRNGQSLRGWLTEVTPKTLILEKQLTRGTFSYELRKDEIAALYVVRY